MFKTIANAFKIKDIRKKILLTLLLLFIYRLGCWLPAVGFDASSIMANEGNNVGFFSLMNMVSGGALQNCSALYHCVNRYTTFDGCHTKA